MTVGLPGVGIGGIFYLVSALTMPLRELVRTVRRESSVARWRLVGKQWALAVGILVALWLTGKLIGLLIGRVAASAPSSGIMRGVTSHNVLQVSALALSLGTLSLVWLTVHVLRVVLRWRGGIPPQALSPMPAAMEPAHERAFTHRQQLAAGARGRRVDSGKFERWR